MHFVLLIRTVQCSFIEQFIIIEFLNFMFAEICLTGKNRKHTRFVRLHALFLVVNFCNPTLNTMPMRIKRKLDFLKILKLNIFCSPLCCPRTFGTKARPINIQITQRQAKALKKVKKGKRIKILFLNN